MKTNKHERVFVLQVRYRDLNNSCEWYFQNHLTRFCLHLDGGGILELFYLYSKIPDSFGRWRHFGSVSFVLKIPYIFWCWRNFGSILFVLINIGDLFFRKWIYFICTDIFKVSWLFWEFFGNIFYCSFFFISFFFNI